MGILESFSLKNKVALAEAGSRTYIASRNLAALEQLAAEHRALGHDVRALPVDQTDEKSITALRDAIL